jgi:gephyrin
VGQVMLNSSSNLSDLQHQLSSKPVKMSLDSSRPEALTVALLIVSDTASKDPSTDKCTPTLRSLIEDESGKWELVDTQIVPDEIQSIQDYIKKWADERKVNCLLTSGGTGFAVKDNTPEVNYLSSSTQRLTIIKAVEPLIHRHAPGLV